MTNLKKVLLASATLTLMSGAAWAGDLNTANVEEYGNNNTLYINQDVYNGGSSSNHVGYYAPYRTDGSNNDIRIVQSGNGNVADGNTSGNSNTIRVTQAGASSSYANTNTSGSSNVLYVTQSGNSHYANVATSGNSNYLNVSQSDLSPCLSSTSG